MDKLHRVKFHGQETGHTFDFLINNELPALEIAFLYKSRW
jgi:hypothetical protein